MHATRFPPYLAIGSNIGIVCPAGYMAREAVETCVNTLISWGFKVVIGSTIGSGHNYFAGSDEERLADLQNMLDDSTIHAILCARGGYGMSRIIDDIDFNKFIQHPKWVIGFSDITLLLQHIYSNYNIASLHAPMAAAFNNGGATNEYIASLKQAITGAKQAYTCNVNNFNKLGEASGIVVGGNLTLLAHAIGSTTDIVTNNCLLFVEDIGEYLYALDRMFLQLKRAGKLQHIAGLIVGGFSDVKDTIRPFGSTIEEVIASHLNAYNYPICYNFPVSHATENYALKIGATYHLKVSEQQVKLTEL